MNYLLDTHTFLWMDGDPDRLSALAARLCQNQANTLILSVVSVWEVQIKQQLGKLQLRAPLAEIIVGQQNVNNLVIMPIDLKHVLALANLPDHHKDPFDRLLIAQAMVEKISSSAELLDSPNILCK